MSRSANKHAAATAASRHYRRAAIAGGLIAALLLALLLMDQAPPLQGDARALPAPEPADIGPTAPAADPAPAPTIMSISIPPLVQKAGTPAPPSGTTGEDDSAAASPGPSAAAGVSTAAGESLVSGEEGAAAAPAPAAAPTAVSPPGPAAVSPPGPAAVSEPAPPLPGNGYFIQLGVFGAQANAEALRLELAAQDTPAYLESRVVVGPYPTRKAAESARQRLRSDGYPDGLLVPPRNP